MLQRSQRSLKTKNSGPERAVHKGRAGGGVPPWGRQSAARPGGARAAACQTPNRRCQNLSNSFLHLTAYLLRRSFWTSPRSPPGGLRIPPGCTKRRIKIDLMSIKILIVFWTRFLVDFGSSWGAKLGSFSALLAPKMGQVRSKTRLESLSLSKT